jgi:predicted membrane protein
MIAFFRPSTNSDEMQTAMWKIFATWALYFGSLNLMAWLQLIGLFLGCVFTATQTYLLWRDKVLKKQEEDRIRETQPQNLR